MAHGFRNDKPNHQAPIELAVSGHAPKGWLHGSMTGPEWLSGGAYGVEASAVALLTWVVASALLLRLAHSRGKFLPRRQASSEIDM